MCNAAHDEPSRKMRYLIMKWIGSRTIWWEIISAFIQSGVEPSHSPAPPIDSSLNRKLADWEGVTVWHAKFTKFVLYNIFSAISSPEHLASQWPIRISSIHPSSPLVPRVAHLKYERIDLLLSRRCTWRWAWYVGIFLSVNSCNTLSRYSRRSFEEVLYVDWDGQCCYDFSRYNKHPLQLWFIGGIVVHFNTRFLSWVLVYPPKVSKVGNSLSSAHQIHPYGAISHQLRCSLANLWA